jgi:hypothetical protein
MFAMRLPTDLGGFDGTTRMASIALHGHSYLLWYY